MSAPRDAGDDVVIDPVLERCDVEFVGSSGDRDGAAYVGDLSEVDPRDVELVWCG
jgi:hypothetical protein